MAAFVQAEPVGALLHPGLLDGLAAMLAVRFTDAGLVADTGAAAAVAVVEAVTLGLSAAAVPGAEDDDGVPAALELDAAAPVLATVASAELVGRLGE
jgi:hypothetical protein